MTRTNLYPVALLFRHISVGALLLSGACTEPIPKDQDSAEQSDTTSSADSENDDASTMDTAGATDSESSASGETDDDSTSDSGQNSTDEILECGAASGECLPRVPLGWEGPVQPQITRDRAMLRPCPGSDDAPQSDSENPEGPSAAENIFVQAASWKPAECSTCEAILTTGECNPPVWAPQKFVENGISCAGPQHAKTEDPAFLIPMKAECTRVPDYELLGDSHPAWGLLPPEPELDTPFCDLAPQTSDIEPIEHPAYFRFCEAKAVEGSCQSDAGCFELESDSEAELYQPYACIYQHGDVGACPPGEYAVRTLLYGGLEDTRSCSACELSDEPGNLSCSIDVLIAASNKKPENGCLEEMPSALADVCMSSEDGAWGGPWFARYENLQISYDGTCEVNGGGEAQGEVKYVEPITLCCTANN